jgi:hypothetical protein
MEPVVTTMDGLKGSFVEKEVSILASLPTSRFVVTKAPRRRRFGALEDYPEMKKEASLLRRKGVVHGHGCQLKAVARRFNNEVVLCGTE